MASITPRASGFWADATMSSGYFPDGDGDYEQQNLLEEVSDDVDDGRTPLDRTIDRIGMGSYQWALLSLCGFGWMADNMWIQAIAIILPRVQQHYSVADNYIGMLSSSMFAGMMFGAVGWGTCSDLMGRSAAFNATLFFTSLFGLLASFADSFPSLCVLLFFLGSSVGGSMPTDGTLLLEHMPKGKQYLVTALSVFFSFGAVLSAVVALLVVPQHSCLASAIDCDIANENKGWKYLLVALGLITLSMFLARIVFFRLHESPRYLVHAGRPQEALESLQLISRFNGSDLTLDLDDVQDHQQPKPESPNEGATSGLVGNGKKNDTSSSPPVTAALDSQVDGSGTHSPSTTSSRTIIKQYDSTGESQIPLDGHLFLSPVVEQCPPSLRVESAHLVNTQTPPSAHNPTLRTPSHPTARLSRHLSRDSSRRASSIYEKGRLKSFPRWLRRPLAAWWDRVLMVLAPEWIRTTLLMWAVWWAMSLAYTMFNVFLPKLLETRPTGGGADTLPKTLEESLWDVVIFTIGGCPGAILGAYMIESSLGRRWSLAGSTFITALLCVIFIQVESTFAVRLTTVGISLSATAMWAVLYGWTPEIFGTKVRGTACGISSALSRIGGMIAPLLGGILLTVDRSFPVYASVIIFAIAGICVLLLDEYGGDSGDRTKSDRAVVH